jgi:hypothetical protein
MTVELIWLAGIVAVGSGIVGCALFTEVSEHYRRRPVKSSIGSKAESRR